MQAIATVAYLVVAVIYSCKFSLRPMLYITDGFGSMQALAMTANLAEAVIYSCKYYALLVRVD